MRSFAILALALGGVSAFPAILESTLEKRAQVAKTGCSTNSACSKIVRVTNAQAGYSGKPNAAQKISQARTNCGAQGPCLTFNAADQLISTTGQYAYASPAADEIRGPCPGLNAAANHGYLPRSGVASITQTIDGLGKLYSMGPDLAGFLAAYAVVFDGDLITQTWSIGGPPPADTLGGLLGQPQGISYSHNKYEGDSSIGRCDAYVNGGDAHSLDTTRFGYAFSTGLLDNRYTLDKFALEFTKNAMRSEQTNPLYFAPLFSTTLVSPAAYNFVINFMSNHTAEEPSGYLDKDIFKTFFAISGHYPNFKWHPGQERIPDNWYKRTATNQYAAVQGVFGDLAPQFAAYPKSFRFGGNTNGVNSYVGVDIANLTNGVYTAQNLFKGNNLACFFYQNEQQALPDELKGGINDAGKALSLLSGYLDKAFGALDCPQVSKFKDNDNSKYPGFSYSPTGAANNC